MKYYVKFNDNKQTLVFITHRKTVRAFRSENKCFAWYIAKDKRRKRKGVFGYVHMPEVAKITPLHSELVAHEVQHAIFDWILAYPGDTRRYMMKNEERVATMTGEIVRRFKRQYTKGKR